MRKLIKNRSGQSIIEFALVLPVLLMIMFGVVEFGRAIMISNVMHQATREGARLAVVSPDPTNTVPVYARMDELLTAANITPSVRNLTYDPVTRTVRIDCQTEFNVIAGGIIGTVSFPISASTVMKVES